MLFRSSSLLQGAFIVLDEFIFHRKRGLPRWELIGHPIDTATVLACLAFLIFMDRTRVNEIIYSGMAIISCLCVTKDEWVHWKFCPPGELWMHAVLFILHPIVLFSAMSMWEINTPIIAAVASAISVFFVYQVVYWNFLEARLRKSRQQAHYQKVTTEELYEYFGE